MKKRLIALVLSTLLIVCGTMTAWAADNTKQTWNNNDQETEILLADSVDEEQSDTITGFPQGDDSERYLYISKEDKPSLEVLLQELPDTLNVYVNNSSEVITIPVTYECVGESYEDSDSYYFQFSPVWDESKYSLADGLERIKDAPYYSLFLYDTEDVSELSVTGSTNEATVYSFLVNKVGFNSAGACGVMANIQHESSFNPHATGDNGTSYGICQWHNSRWTAMKNWCKANGYDSTTLTGQLNYLKFELSQNNSNYLWNGKTIYNKIKGGANSAQGAYDAGYYWCYYYEVPANKEKVSVTRGNLAKNSYWPEYGKSVAKPSSVSDLKIGGRAADALRLNWNKNTTAEGYIIEQYKNNAWTRIARIGSNSTTTYRVENLKAFTTYKFRVRSFNFNGKNPQYSDFQYINGKTNPSSPTGVKIGGRAADALRLNWNRNTNAEGYIIEQYKGEKWTRIARIGSNSTTTYRVENLGVSTTYKFRIQSFGFDGNTPLYSAYTYINGKTNPSSMTGVKVGGASRAAIRINWNKNGSAQGYIIEQYKGGKWTRIARIGSNSTTTYRVEKLSSHTTYKFRIQAFNFDGNTPLYGNWSYVNGTTQ